MDKSTARGAGAPAVRETALVEQQTASTVNKEPDVFPVPTARGMGQDGGETQGAPVALGDALSQRLKGVIDARGMSQEHAHDSRAQMPDKVVHTQSVSEQRSSLPIPAVRAGNNSHGCSAVVRLRGAP